MRSTKETQASAYIDNSAYDLTNCEREQIHIPGSIQAHGYLFAISKAGEILYLSENVQDLCGQPVKTLFHKPVSKVLGERNSALILKKLPDENKKRYFSLAMPVANGEPVGVEALIHSVGDYFILELEPLREFGIGSVDLEYFNESIEELQDTPTPKALSELVARKIKDLTGFSRVMIYRFMNDGSGEVIAEAKDPEQEPYLGLRYPATDIPQQARKLYSLSSIRNIPDVHYTPVPIMSDSEAPLDLSRSSLRSVSPFHIQYLHNMGVGASMSVSIVRNNQLWGLIACHHQQPHYLTYQYRQLCELLSRSYAMLLGEKEDAVMNAYKERIEGVKDKLVQFMGKSRKFTDGLHKHEPTVQQLIRCGGCVMTFGEGYISLGETPSKEQVTALVRWLQKNVDEEVFHTHQLPILYPEAEAYHRVGSGILAVAVSQVQQEYIIWFRPEQVEKVSWAGKQEKEMSEEDGVLQLHPRKSFETWVETVRNTSIPWLPVEIKVARELRGEIVDIVMRLSGELKLRADILARLNKELDTSKNELDSFAYIASHDLKEPLRGINHYASFMLEDYGAQLNEDGQAKLQTMLRLSERMQQLIDSLLHFSRMGRLELQKKELNLSFIEQEAQDVFGMHFSGGGAELHTPESWPVVSCDPLRITEVFINLISNGLKYNDKEKKIITLGYRKAREEEQAPSGYVFFVKDNGIGIKGSQQEKIFNIFKRLHARDAYGGGTGAGLTIVKKIVERHQGKIWVESEEGKGSSFYFTI